MLATWGVGAMSNFKFVAPRWPSCARFAAYRTDAPRCKRGTQQISQLDVVSFPLLAVGWKAILWCSIGVVGSIAVVEVHHELSLYLCAHFVDIWLCYDLKNEPYEIFIHELLKFVHPHFSGQAWNCALSKLKMARVHCSIQSTFLENSPMNFECGQLSSMVL